MENLTLQYMEKLEKEFSLNNYQGIKTEKESFKILKGDKKILVSCPHSIDQMRRGMLKPRELYSGTLGKLMHEYAGTYLIYKYHNDSIDDNFVLHTRYKQAIGRLIREEEIKLVIDIHGMVGSKSKRFRGDFIELGTDYGKNLLGHVHVVDIIKRCLSFHGIEGVAVDNHFKASHDYTIAKYISKYFKTPSVQIEVSGDYRNPLTYDIEDVKKFLLAFKDIIDVLDESL